MGRFRYSYSVPGSSAGELCRPVDRLAKLGYEAVGLGGEIPLSEAEKVRGLVEDAGMSVASICPSFTADRDLSHPDAEVRENAVRYVRGLADLACAAGAPKVIVAPTAFRRDQPLASQEQEWGWAVESITACGEYAEHLGVDLTLECWNRYGTYLLNRLEQAVRLMRETGLENGGVMADTYHMNIEERSLPEAIRQTGDLLNHVHLSDSNRAAPGQGHIDFGAILRTLVEIGYSGYLTFELDVQAALRSGAARAEDDPQGRLMEQAIEHTRRLESRL
jgi:sugar phosphate isomerase/epimerase